MLVLTRKIGERIITNNNSFDGDQEMIFTVLDINRNQVKLGIDAPRTVEIFREEILRKIMAERDIKGMSLMHMI